ncbi:M28 family peptidase [Miniphocaeibacter massiliensis]|uniref:M28 family peptidase n=1 Tax=Miniphocaeibacter massiliensis TaxID=2041841 RepID=UPI000C06BD6D|nr:M28 family peptidase [Miniphocaeibacter massiliensis]
MRENINELIEKYQVRKSYTEKTKFIEWVDEKTKSLDYNLTIDKYSKKGRNIIIGNVETSEMIFTAHYDTQANFFIPMFMGVSWFGFILGQLYLLIAMFFIPILTNIILSKFVNDFIATYISLIVLILVTLQMQFGYANKNTVNDNTSGVATIFSIMEDLPKEFKNKVSFVLFDQEEIGLIGSTNFNNKYRNVIEEKPLINFDCVSNGDNFAFITKKHFRNSKYNNCLNSSIEKIIEKDCIRKTYFIGKAIKYVYPSDQLIFKNSVGVAALKKAPILGYYLSGIHNSRDKVFMKENIEILKDIMIDFIKNERLEDIDG